MREPILLFGKKEYCLPASVITIQNGRFVQVFFNGALNAISKFYSIVFLYKASDSELYKMRRQGVHMTRVWLYPEVGGDSALELVNGVTIQPGLCLVL